MHTTANVSEMLQEIEKLPQRDFEIVFRNVLSINAKRYAPQVPNREGLLLEKINRAFSAAKMSRLLELDELRQREIISETDLKELLKLTQEVERFDAQRIKNIGELALLKNLSFDEMMSKLGL